MGRKLYSVLAAGVVGLLGFALARECAAQEQHTIEVSPGGKYGPILFSSDGKQPIWRLTVNVGPKGWAHKEGTQTPNNTLWQAYFKGRAGYFECSTAANPCELEFQQVFRGELVHTETEGGAPGGEGGVQGADEHWWEALGKTRDSYFVVPSEANGKRGETVTFEAVNAAGAPVKSSWTVKPNIPGKLPDGASVDVTPNKADVVYQVTGTALAPETGSDTAELVSGKGDDDGGGGGPKAQVSAVFSSDNKSVTAKSTKDLSNVVLKFTDGVHQKFDGLQGYSMTFSGTGKNNGKAIAGVWIKSGDNDSGDGPGYGQYVDNPNL